MKITGAQFQKLIEILARVPSDVLLSARCREYLARDRWATSAKRIEKHAANEVPNQQEIIAISAAEVEQERFPGALTSQLLIGPLSAIAPVYKAAASLTVLVVGARTEMEILHLMGIGFQPKNIEAIDLFSSSPLIRAGNMHALPFDDRSFDVVLSSGTLLYSHEPAVAVSEMLRCLKWDGLLALSTPYSNGEPSPIAPSANTFKSADDLKRLVGQALHYIYFQQDPHYPIAEPYGLGSVSLICRVRYKN